MGIGSIVESRKYYKRNKIINLIRHHQNVSRFDIKKMTSYSMSTVLSIIDELIADELIHEEACDESRVGRKPQWLKLNPEGGFFFGFEFNIRAMHFAVLNFAGETILSDSCPMSASDTPGIILDRIRQYMTDALERMGCQRKKLLGIGMGLPGYLDPKNGEALSYAQIPAWTGVPVKKMIETEFGVPCYVESNVNMMAFAYRWLKQNDELNDYLFVSVRSGVRIVPVVDGILYLNHKGLAGQLGHIKVPGSNRLCTCGKTGSLNSEISDSAVVIKLIEGIRMGRFKALWDLAGHDLNAIDLDLFIQSVKENHQDSLALLQEIGHTLGHSLGMAIDIFAPKVVVLSGDMMKINPILIDSIRKGIVQNSLSDNHCFELIESEFDDHLGAIGSAATAMQEEFEFIDKYI